MALPAWGFRSGGRGWCLPTDESQHSVVRGDEAVPQFQLVRGRLPFLLLRGGGNALQAFRYGGKGPRSSSTDAAQVGFLLRGLLARCRGFACRVSISGLIVGTGAMASSHDSRPSARSTSISVRNVEPLPDSRFRRARTLMPARSESVAWSRLRCMRYVLRCPPSSASLSSGVRCR